MKKQMLVAAAALTALLAFGAETRPNFLIFLSDDVGWGDFQCYNPQGKIPTPNVDKLAQAGMRFTDAHTPAALCAPTRYAMLTGNYPWRGAKPGGTWSYNGSTQFLPGQKTIGKILQEAGYRTAIFGKVNVGGVWETGDNNQVDWSKPMKDGPIQWGFDYSYILMVGHQGPPYCFVENNRVDGDASQMTQLKQGPLNGGMIPRDGPGLPGFDSRKVGESIARKAIGFLDDHLAKNRAAGKEHPFYIHFCSDGAHGPYTPPETLLGSPVKGASKMTAHTDMVHEVDVLLGKLVAALDERGLLTNTLILLTSDNGGLPFEREYGHDAVGGLRGYKSFIFEGGHRVPYLVRWGDGTPAGSKIPPGTVRHQVIGAHDIVATMAELGGARLGPDQALDSVSLVPVLLGQRDDQHPVRQTLLLQSSPGRDAFMDKPPTVAPAEIKAQAKRKGKAKAKNATRLAVNRVYARAAQAAANTGSDGMAHALREGPWKLTFDLQDKPVALYNLAEDLAEQKNRIDDPAQADRIKRMDQMYRAIRKSKRSLPPLS